MTLSTYEPSPIEIFLTRILRLTVRFGVIPFMYVQPVSRYETSSGEQALVVNLTGKGPVIVTGCGHPTDETLVNRAEALYGLPVIGVFGGLHYGNASAESLAGHIEFLKLREPLLVALSPHDNIAQGLTAFETTFPQASQSTEVGVPVTLP